MVRRPHYIGLVLVLLLVLMLFKLPSQTATNLKLAVGSLFLPLFGLSASGQTASDHAALALLPRSELIRQNERLRQDNEQLQVRLMQQEEAWRENARLRQQLAWREQTQWNVKLARVIGRDPANWWRTIHIDLGSRDGVQPNLPVMTPKGLVGRTSTVSETRAQIVLLGDPNLRVGALVQETREAGVVLSSSQSALDHGMIDLAYLAGTTGVKPGHTVLTSGDGGIFPKGIVIGTVLDVRQVDFGLAGEARVRLAANLKSLEEVWIMLP
jgi:rod shape-determining protein MreC